MKVVVVSSLAYSLTNFRGALIRRIVNAGHDVLACAPDRDEAVAAALHAMGARFAVIPMARASLNPFGDLRTLAALVALVRQERPDVILAYTQKPIIYGGLAHRITRTGRFVPMVTGLGYAFSESGRRPWLRQIVARLYRAALARATSVIVYNPDDEEELRQHRVLSPAHRVVLIPGSGVDTSYFARQPVPPGPPVFLVIARLLYDKGLREFVRAAAIVRRHHPEARFQLLGGLDANPASIKADELERWRTEGVIDYLGETRDVRPFLAAASVFVLPSYREGMPRTILEAMATGRAIITTDVPGCREAVVPGENGLVVPVKDSEALAEAMMQLCRQPALIEAMGAVSRQLAEQRYAVEIVNAAVVEVLGISEADQAGEAPFDRARASSVATQ